MATKKYIQDPNNPNASIPQPIKPLSALTGGTTAYAQTPKTAVVSNTPSVGQTDQNKVAASSSTLNTDQQNNLKNILVALKLRQENNIPANQTTADYFAKKTTPTTTTLTTTVPTTTTPTGTSALADMANKGTLYSQLVQNLANYNTFKENPGLEQAYNTAANLESGLQAGNVAIQAKPIPLEFQQGQMAALQRDYGPQLTAAQNILAKEQALAQQKLSGLQTAVSAAAPAQVPYNVQYVNPLTGLPIGGGTTGSMTDAVNNIITKVKNGTMGYDAGVSALSAYGQAGVNALQQGLGPDFNIQESNARAAAQGASTLQTGTIGGQIEKASDAANQALDKLQTDFTNLPDLEKFGLPGMIGVEQSIGKFFGNEALSTYETTLNDARSQISAVLSATGTPSTADETAKTYLPNNMTLNQLKSKIAAAKELIRQRVESYTGQNSTGGTTTPSGTITWDNL